MNTRVLLPLLFILVPVAAMYVWFNHRPPVPKPLIAAKTQAAPAPVVLPPKAEAVMAEAVKEPRHYRPPPVTAEVRRKVDDFIRRFKDMPPGEQGKSEEFVEIMTRFAERLNTPEFQRKIQERITAIQAAKGAKHGTLNIASENLNDPESRIWLEALFSDDVQSMEDYIMNKLDGAIFDLAFDPTLEKTEGGVTVKSDAPPAAVPDKLPD